MDGGHHPCIAAAAAGIASLTIPPDSTTTAFDVVRPGIGKVRSRTGRWSDFSSVDITLLPAAAAAGISGDTTAAAAVAAGTLKVHYGVQWSQRRVTCRAVMDAGNANGGALSDGAAEVDTSVVGRSNKPVCAMPSPWLGQLVV